MRVEVDWDRCIGSGMCTTIAPALFDLDDDGAMIVVNDTPEPEQERSLLDAVACCPVNALSTADA